MQTYPTGYAESHRIAEQIFREILPRHGMAVREEQIALCHEILDTLYNKEISLCEAGVGIGKTLAYLVACILWQMHRPSQLKMPVVISTSSVALQDAILNEYLPDLSAIMLAEGIITAPITAVVRKGKERFVCDARLAERQEKAISKGKRQKNSLRMAESILDLDHIALDQQLREKKKFLSKRTTDNSFERVLFQTRSIQQQLGSSPPLETFDGTIFTKLVNRVQVSPTTIEFKFMNGMTLSEKRSSL